MRAENVVPDTPTADQAIQVIPHGASIGALFMAFLGWLPGIVAVVPAIYYGLLIYESKTVQGWLKRRSARKRAKRVAARIRARSSNA